MVFYECGVFKGRDAAITKSMKSMPLQLLNTAVSSLVAFYIFPLYWPLNFDITHICCWKISGFPNFPMRRAAYTFCDMGCSVPKTHVQVLL